MKTIHKIPLDIKDVVTVRTHAGAEPLLVACQEDPSGRWIGEKLCVWFRVDTEKPEVTRRLRIAGTGHAVPTGTHIGSALMGGGRLVWHAFDLGEGT